MGLTILADAEVRDLLDTLTAEDVLKMHMKLADALHTYSTGTDSSSSSCCASNQPNRIIMSGKDGSNTLFMPATGDDTMGVKVLTVNDSAKASDPPTNLDQLNVSESSTTNGSMRSVSRTDSSSTRSSSIVDSSASTSTQSTSTHSASSGSTSTGSTSATNQSAPPAEELKEPLDFLQPAATSPKGSITLLSHTGEPRALINASTLTAFRTALASTLLLKKRKYVHTLTVFGAGLQAYWHIFLTLVLRGSELHHLNVINRDFGRAQRMLMQLGHSNNEAVTNTFLTQKLRPGILTPEYGEYSRLLKEQVRAADIIYCCTPSTVPLFPAGHLTHNEGRKKGRYIACIGSYKPHMQELHEDILRQAVAAPSENSHSRHNHPHLHIGHSHAHEGGAIVVDTIEGAMKEAGDIIKAGISGQGVVELGEVVMLKRSHWAEKAEREKQRLQQESVTPKGGHGISHLFHHLQHKDEKKEPQVDDGGLGNWLERGNVIYKSVGLGLMDIVVGTELIQLAEERGFGTTIHGF